ncbi:MAG: hypothetical protein ABF976_06090 [Acetobacter syzygii]|uniref:hypothetical protein n=1 Tax=Acetobacter syzygii TaxID=146476 RepID=UPI00242E686E|nr:hypothetical protein [Acetobacter syzygii]
MICPPWKRSDCRTELLARPYLHEVHKLESQTGEEKLAALLAALIMRFLAILFGVRVEIPPLTAQAARQRIEEKTQELAQARQEAVRAHFETDGVYRLL